MSGVWNSLPEREIHVDFFNSFKQYLDLLLQGSNLQGQ